MPIRVLRLTNSDDFNADIPPELRAAAIGDRMLKEATGQEVETVSRHIWPTSALPALIARWVDQHEPDLVLIRVASYWFTYESVPLKIERALGPWSRRLTKVGNRAAESRVIGHSRAFKLLQKAALRTIGGATLLTADETVAATESYLRPVLAREGVGVVVRGPRTPFGMLRSQAGMRKSEQRRQYVNRKLADLCEKYHVTFTAFETMDEVTNPALRMADFVHTNEGGQQQVGAMEGEALVREWQRTQSPVS
jgi:hypothetical protein